MEKEIISLLEQNKKLEEDVKMARLKEKDTEKRLSADFELKWQHLFGEKENNNYPDNANLELSSSKVLKEKINWKNNSFQTKDKTLKELLLSKYNGKEIGIREKIENELFEASNDGKKEIYATEKKEKTPFLKKIDDKKEFLFDSNEKKGKDPFLLKNDKKEGSLFGSIEKNERVFSPTLFPPAIHLFF